jgi:hypothetical protein
MVTAMVLLQIIGDQDISDDDFKQWAAGYGMEYVSHYRHDNIDSETVELVVRCKAEVLDKFTAVFMKFLVSRVDKLDPLDLPAMLR